MKIFIFSDSHSDVDTIREVIKERKDEINYVIHLGDYARDAAEIDHLLPVTPLLVIRGNCDLFDTSSDAVDERVVELYGKRIFLCHGHQFGAKSNYDGIRYAAQSNHCSIALFGHTHLPFIETKDNITLFNPGSIGKPHYGMKKSYGVIELNEYYTSFDTFEVET